MKPAPQPLLPCLVMIALVGCSSHKAPAAAAPAKVSTVTAEQQTVPLTRDLVGRLSAYFSANVVARVSGVLVKRTYKEGDEVKQGQLLFEIDPSYYTAVLNNNLAILAEDQATYTNNRVTAERNHKLLPVGSVSQQTVDDADAAQRSAAAKVQADQAAVATARINLGYTRVTSPISGTASQQQVTQGALVGSATNDAGSGGTLLTTVQRIDPLYVNFTISAADLLTLRQAQNVALAQQNDTKVQITLPNGTPYEQSGALDFSDVAANPTTGAVNLRALVPNPKHELLPGMYVTLRITLGQQSHVYLIPQQAVQRDTVGAYALVVGPGDKVLRKNVTTGESYGNDWIVTGGLESGDQVIVAGLQGAREGGQVKASPWQSPPLTASPPSTARNP
ncbi:MAG TPA: efflux RND transporter periplasmic adaptor subunit [Steroidobacteraceae bacterium]|nr:efflux RND transporter periplasmic adaptor subunit [Steroidobacteraceae bacterium]